MQTFGKATEKDPEAIANLRRTEELFRKALENAGLDYAVQNAAETVDEKAGVRYNRRTTVDEKAGTDYLIHNFSGEVKYDP